MIAFFMCRVYLIFISKPFPIYSHRHNIHEITFFWLQLQKYDITGNNARKMRKSKERVKKEPKNSLVKEEKHEPEDYNEKANNKTANIEDKAAVIRGYEEFISGKKNIVWITYQQDKIFEIFKEKENFIIIVRNFNVNTSTMIFKINIVKLAIDKIIPFAKFSKNLYQG